MIPTRLATLKLSKERVSLLIAECKLCAFNEIPLVLPRFKEQPIGNENYTVAMGYTVDNLITQYRVTVGLKYEVYGILVYKEQIRFLIQDDDNIPVFSPSELFLISDPKVFWDWKITQYSTMEGILLLIGYPAILDTFEDFVCLVERNNRAIEGFLDYKRFCEKYSMFE